MTRRLVVTGVIALLGVGSLVAMSGPTVADAPTERTADEPAVRLAGEDRFATAKEVAGRVGADDEVWLSTGEDFADALAAGATGRAPLLLTPAEATPQTTRDAVAELDASRLLVAGGDAAVPAARADDVADAAGADVERLAGEDRFATAAAIAQEAHPDGADTVYLATGVDFPDALAAGTAAAAEDAPLLLAADEVLPAATADALSELDPDEVVGVGGPAVLPEAALDEAGRRANASTVTRVAGSQRFATAAELARRAFPDGADAAYVVTGDDWPDALAASAAAAREGVPLLLNSGVELGDDTRGELERLAPRQVVVVGGSAVVPDDVEDVAAGLVLGELSVDDLLSAPVPSLCEHPPGRLVDGTLPGIDERDGQVTLQRDQTVMTDLRDDGRPEAVAATFCTRGGVSWPQSVHVYAPGPVRLLTVALVEVVEPRGTSRAHVHDLVVDGDEVEVTWITSQAGDFGYSVSLPARLRLRAGDDGGVEVSDVATYPERDVAERLLAAAADGNRDEVERYADPEDADEIMRAGRSGPFGDDLACEGPGNTDFSIGDADRLCHVDVEDHPTYLVMRFVRGEEFGEWRVDGARHTPDV